MRPVLSSLYLLLVPMITYAQMDHTHSPAIAEDCTKLSHQLQAVVAAMDRTGSRVEALPKRENIQEVQPGVHKLEVALLPLSDVELMGKKNQPRQVDGEMMPSENAENLFGGFIRLIVQRDGMYRISADSTLWIEVREGEKPLERIKIAPRLHCGLIHKSLVFPLKREGSYWLELSSSKRPEAALLITEEAEH